MPAGAEAELARERELHRVLQVESARLEAHVAVAEFREKRDEERRRRSAAAAGEVVAAKIVAADEAAGGGDAEEEVDEEEDEGEDADLDGALAAADAAAEAAVRAAEAGRLSAEGEARLDRLLRQCDRLQARLVEVREENAALEALVEVERRRGAALEDAARVGEASLAEQDRRHARDVEALARDRDALEAALADKSDAFREQSAELGDAREALLRARADLEEAQVGVALSERSRYAEEQRANERALEQVRVLEQRVEEERANHASTRTEAALREGNLEAQVTDAQRNLARAQRAADAAAERADKAAREARDLERDARQAHERADELEARLERAERAAGSSGRGDGSGGGVGPAAGAADALREEVERLRSQLEDAREEVERLEAEVQRVRVEAVAGAQQELEDLRAMRGENDVRFSQLTEHLYAKQSQLENAMSERHAAQLAAEREQRAAEELRAEISELRRRGQAPAAGAALRGAPVEGFMPTVPVYREPGLNRRVVSVANVLDQASANFLVLMRSFPLLRLAFIAYLAGFHVFVYVVLHRLQNIHVDHHDDVHGALPGLDAPGTAQTPLT